MVVVTIAMITSIVYILSSMTPASRPMVSTTSSVRPRVFISAPTASDCRRGTPIKRAAMAPPKNLPMHATAMMAITGTMSCTVRPCRFTPCPAITKNTGNSSCTLTPSILPAIEWNRFGALLRGRATPNRNPPISSCTPMRLVMYDDNNSPTNRMLICSGPILLPLRRYGCSTKRSSSGRTTTKSTATKAASLRMMKKMSLPLP